MNPSHLSLQLPLHHHIIISSDSEHPEIPDPSSLTLAQLKAIALSNQPSYIPDTSVPSPSEPQTKAPSEPQTEPPFEPSSEPQTE